MTEKFYTVDTEQNKILLCPPILSTSDWYFTCFKCYNQRFSVFDGEVYIKCTSCKGKKFCIGCIEIDIFKNTKHMLCKQCLLRDLFDVHPITAEKDTFMFYEAFKKRWNLIGDLLIKANFCRDIVNLIISYIEED
jgi:hypothetical protein